MFRKLAPVLLLALLLGLAGCKKDGEVDAFIKDFNGLTNDIVKKVEASPNAAGLDEAQKLLDAKKGDMKERLDSLKGLRGFQVSEGSVKKLTDSITTNGQKIVDLTTTVGVQAFKDPSVQPKLTKLVNDYTDMLK